MNYQESFLSGVSAGFLAGDSFLTHRGRVRQLCVSILIIIGSDNISTLGRRPKKTIIWTNDGVFQWNLNRNSYIFIQENAFENSDCKMEAILSRSQCFNCPPGVMPPWDPAWMHLVMIQTTTSERWQYCIYRTRDVKIVSTELEMSKLYPLFPQRKYKFCHDRSADPFLH